METDSDASAAALQLSTIATTTIMMHQLLHLLLLWYHDITNSRLMVLIVEVYEDLEI